MWRGSFQGLLTFCVHLWLIIFAGHHLETPLHDSVSYVQLQASVFVQSHVRAHVELMWLLSSATPIGWLNRMIQFKEKSRKAVSAVMSAA